jgi:biotin synthase
MSRELGHNAEIMSDLAKVAREEMPLGKELGLAILNNQDLDLDALLELAALPRHKYFERGVRIHILNNVRNGYCPEDCGYCAQRKTRAEDIPAYGDKNREEILAEARAARDAGAYRYCMVSSGRGPTSSSIEGYADLIRTIKDDFGLEVCLSAGLLTDEAQAQKLADAGLDRYNHNLNTSESHYGEICQSHDYADRMRTLEVMQSAGVSLCSGVIAGMGETETDLVELALTLKSKQVPSIPINFFIPVPGHAISNPRRFTAAEALRILVLFRLANPQAEVRMAAGREIYLKGEQHRALKAANSLFVSGYLNAKGSDAQQTLDMIYSAGYEVDLTHSDLPAQLDEVLQNVRERNADVATAGAAISDALRMKEQADLRPYAKSNS